MHAVTIVLLVAVVIAAFAMKFETLRIFWNALSELFQSDEMPGWMIKVIIAVALIAVLLGFYLAWRYP